LLREGTPERPYAPCKYFCIRHRKPHLPPRHHTLPRFPAIFTEICYAPSGGLVCNPRQSPPVAPLMGGHCNSNPGSNFASRCRYDCESELKWKSRFAPL
jgi:hypothetical protein